MADDIIYNFFETDFVDKCLKSKHKVNTFMGLHKDVCKNMLKKAEQSEITLFSTESLFLPPPCTVHHLNAVNF
jgi:hypothetical protein